MAVTALFQVSEIGQNKFAQGREKKHITWYGPAFLFFDVSQQASGFVPSNAVWLTTFRRDLPYLSSISIK